ncbi:hypothetical protein HU200_011277 [Digitaria exilis]|uniref:Uncharacterized protein n=1 Tax=Digitaria exilis TaxID=1010633 RepID=A0A835FH23_9POAL|nr:hypothetical protein HU200_011277 [Digitaria exilis]
MGGLLQVEGILFEPMLAGGCMAAKLNLALATGIQERTELRFMSQKWESGWGFQEYRKEGAAKQGSSGSKRGTAKPKKEPAATKQSTSRVRRKR